MRVYGRNASGAWVVVQTDANGNNDLVYATALLQVIALNLGESPFFSWAGIPAQESVVSQVYPDYYISLIQQIYAPYFISLLIVRRPPTAADPTPIYDANLITHQGVLINPSTTIPR